MGTAVVHLQFKDTVEKDGAYSVNVPLYVRGVVEDSSTGEILHATRWMFNGRKQRAHLEKWCAQWEGRTVEAKAADVNRSNHNVRSVAAEYAPGGKFYRRAPVPNGGARVYARARRKWRASTRRTARGGTKEVGGHLEAYHGWDYESTPRLSRTQRRQLEKLAADGEEWAIDLLEALE